MAGVRGCEGEGEPFFACRGCCKIFGSRECRDSRKAFKLKVVIKKHKEEVNKMKFEIINPSDEAYIEGDFKTCCLATLFFGEGKYALRQVDGDLKMPLFLFGMGHEEWLVKQFGKNLKDLLSETPTKDIAKALLSIHLVRERSSLNDFTTYAHNLGKRMMDDEP